MHLLRRDSAKANMAYARELDGRRRSRVESPGQQGDHINEFMGSAPDSVKQRGSEINSASGQQTGL